MAQILRAAKRAAKPPKTQAQKEQYLKYKANKMDNNPTGCEEIFYNMLIDLKIQFETQKIVHGKIFDFYITEKNTLVEVDGTYWHGLDRPIDVIMSSTSPRDVSIFQKWKNEREQDVWFVAHGLKLIRITDVQFISDKLKTLS